MISKNEDKRYVKMMTYISASMLLNTGELVKYGESVPLKSGRVQELDPVRVVTHLFSQEP